MKKLMMLVMLISLSGTLLAQVPQSFSYQAVARNADGSLLANTALSFRISIVQGNPAGTVQYQETQNAVSNDQGLVNLEIGNGNTIQGDMAGIEWGVTAFFLRIEMDPAGGNAYQLMGTSQLMSVPYALYAENSSSWAKSGTNVSMIPSGNAGIGTSTPASKLSVFKNFTTTNSIENILEVSRGTSFFPYAGIGSGLIFKNEVSDGTFPLSARIASVMENVGATSAESGLLFQTRASDGILNDALYIDPFGAIGIGTKSPNETFHLLGSALIDNQDNPNCALTVQGSSVGESLTWFVNNSDDGYASYSEIANSSANTNSIAVVGYNHGYGYGVAGLTDGGNIAIYGENYLFQTEGHMGGYYGVSGYHSSENYGCLGAPEYGATGTNANGNYGSLGSENYGVMGILETSQVGDWGIYGVGSVEDGIGGINYSLFYTTGGVKGFSPWGNTYSFGVAGYSSGLGDVRTGGIIGSTNDAAAWGSMGYKSSGSNLYGGYFSSFNAGNGETSEISLNSGVAAWGDLFGADIHGNIYGAYIEGTNYGSFTNGLVFKNNLDIHLQENGTSENTALYTSVSTDATVQTSGYAVLSGGKASVSFDQRFAASVSPSEPVIVTVTPMGNSKGVFLKEVTKSGFVVEENENGKSNVTFSYIAIGKRKGFENPQLPQEVISADYISKLGKGLHNDNITETNGQGLYYKNGRLVVGKLATANPDPEEIKKALPGPPMKPKKNTVKPVKQGAGMNMSE